MNLRLFLAVVASLTAACAATQSLPAGHRIGERIQPASTYRLAFVDASPEQFVNRTVLVEATVTAVCQDRGCWMQIDDDDSRALVRWETGCGGKYAFPKNLVGKRVLIQGSLSRMHLDETDAEHIESESGGRAKIPREGFELTASAVLILDA